ncbi:MAG: DUF3842 family protein [Clostridia bacterium]|nr:DUF3842 family protein [Clostridia bacterium]
MKILVIDAQGGGLGRQLIAMIRKELPEDDITAVGTNATATAAMLRAGASAAATGENAVRVACRTADVIIGPVGIVIADSMLGEITPAMAVCVAQADAKRILIPFPNCDNYIAGTEGLGTGRLVGDAVRRLVEVCKGEG